MLIKWHLSAVDYPRSSLIFEHDLPTGIISEPLFWQTHCLLVIYKTTPKNQGFPFSLAKKIEKFSTETKLMIVVDTDFIRDQTHLRNISINTILFKMKDGESRNWIY